MTGTGEARAGMGLAHERPAAGDDRREGPIISVIVPTYDRPQALGRCLRALAAQRFPRSRFEVLVCDDGSMPPVSAQHAELIAELDATMQIRVVRQENAGPAAARNRGATLARGRYLAFTDDDCEPAPEWLARLDRRFDVNPDLLLGGGMRNGLAANSCTTATQVIMEFVYAHHWRYTRVRLFSTSNLSLPAAGFHAIGGFSPDFPDAAGEDYDLCVRWQESGGQAEYVHDAFITHHHALTFRAYLRQHFGYGRGLLRVRRRQRLRGRRKRMPGPGFYLRLVLHPLRRWQSPMAWLCALLIAMSQAATVLGAVIELMTPSRRRASGGASPLSLGRSEWRTD